MITAPATVSMHVSTWTRFQVVSTGCLLTDEPVSCMTLWRRISVEPFLTPDHRTFLRERWIYVQRELRNGLGLHAPEKTHNYNHASSNKNIAHNRTGQPDLLTCQQVSVAAVRECAHKNCRLHSVDNCDIPACNGL
jgi:hypothetical protein